MSDFVTVGLSGIVVLIALFFTRLAVAYALAIVGVAGYAVLTSVDSALTLLSRDIYGVFSSYSLALVPLFVFMGFIGYYAGVSRKLYDMAYKLSSGFRGGLGIATVVASTAFGAVCGSTTATAATVGSIALPEMRRYHYGSRLSSGAIAAAAGLGILMPPSVVLIIYGILTQVSIGKLFLAGIVPAVLITFVFAATVLAYAYLDPGQAPRARRFALRERLGSVVDIWETLLVFVLVMGGMFSGIFTPTKAGAIGSALLLALVLLQGRLSWRNFLNAINDTLSVSCMVIMLVAGATIFGHFLALSRLTMELSNLVSGLSWPGWAVMGLICLIYLFAGCFIDALALITLTIPIFYPIVVDLGYDPIWFGVIIVLITQMGTITPPVGVNAFIVKGLSAHLNLEDVFLGVLPFLGALLLGVGVMIAFPSIVTFLPGMMS
jgi:tripartite ATP-independent transporter DctM subunit